MGVRDGWGRNAWRGLPGWLGRLLGWAEQADTDVEAEIRFHLEERREELVAAGVEPGEARRRAESEFGDVVRIEEETRRVARQRVRRLRWWDRLELARRDAGHALRLLARSPGFSAAALLTLALGVGATTAVFTVVDSVLLRPLPYPDPDRLVVVWEWQEEVGRDPTSVPNFLDLRQGGTSFEGLAAWEDLSLTLTGLGEARVVAGAGVTADFFRVLSTSPVQGRPLGPGDGRDVAVISHGLWATLFGGEPDVVGRTLEVEGEAVEVVGVMPAEFRAPRPDTDVWLVSGIEERDDHRSSRYLQMVGRLRPGATAAGAEAELARVASGLAREYPATNRGYTVEVVPALDEVVGEAAGLLVVVLGAVGLLLLLAAVNLSNMLLGRAAARSHEYAVRSALGASGGRLRSQLVVESVVLGVLAFGLGLLIAMGGVEALLRLEPDAIPRATEVTLDYRVLAFALLISLGAGAAAGVAPGVRAARSAPAVALREGGRWGTGSGDRARRSLIVAELGLSLVLLTGAGLLFRTFVALRTLDPGYRTESVLTGRVSLTGERYRAPAARVAYFDGLLERLRALPGVEAAGITTTIPLSPAGIDFDLPYQREGDPPVPEEELPQADYRIISPGYVDAIGMRRIRGRDLAPTDRAGAPPVVLINRTFAERLWPGEDAVGRRLVVHYIADGGVAWEVVGVVEDTRHQGLAAAPQPQMFVPAAQAEWLFNYMMVVVRTRGQVGAVADAVRQAALAIDPTEPVYEIESMARLRAEAMARERLAAALVGIFALLAVILSAAGVYGVVSYQVTRRTREIGVRVALGAARGRILGMVVGEVALVAAAGLALGLAGAMAGARLLEGLLYGVPPVDPLTFGATTAVLAATTLLAAWIPARRATRLDPVGALRAE